MTCDTGSSQGILRSSEYSKKDTQHIMRVEVEGTGKYNLKCNTGIFLHELWSTFRQLTKSLARLDSENQ